MKSTLFKISASLLALACAPLGASAATMISFSGLSGAEYDTAGVYVLGDINYTADYDDGGGYDELLFQLWDDHVLKYETTYSLAVGTTGTFHFDVYYPGLVGTAVRGVGLYTYDDTSSGYYIDPYDVPHYSDPSECKVDCGPVGEEPSPVPLPATGLLLVGGLSALTAMRRKRRKS